MITHAAHQVPGDLWMIFLDFFRDSSSCFTDNDKVQLGCPYGSQVIFEINKFYIHNKRVNFLNYEQNILNSFIPSAG